LKQVHTTSSTISASVYSPRSLRMHTPGRAPRVQGVDAKRVVKVGAVGENIAKVADSGKFDLLVMGSHGHGALATLVMGSVTTQVLAHCKVPLLIVR
jgi:nucleotide-binding universal stress UspA family protein